MDNRTLKNMSLPDINKLIEAIKQVDEAWDTFGKPKPENQFLKPMLSDLIKERDRKQANKPITNG